LGYQKWEISILLVDDPQITKLNKTYLNRNRPTDVIAFSQIEGAFSHLNDHTNLLGDLVISLETAKRQAQEEKTTLKEEVVFLLIHGILHLIGYDHEGSVQKAREMEAQQHKMLISLKNRVFS
jgi:rRNA maturation RNase YbeY